MALLCDRRDTAMLGTLLVGVAFFVLDWILHWPAVWRVVSKPFLSLGYEVEKGEEAEVHRGLRFRIVCAIHNAPQSVMAFLSLMDRSLWRNSLLGGTVLSQLTVIITCGFFIWDVAKALGRARVDGGIPVLHGMVCFSFLFCILCTNRSYFYGCATILWEVSTPFVHARWILYKIGLERTSLYFYNGVSALATYAVFRICWGTFLALKFFVGDRGGLHEDIGAVERGLLCCFCLSGNLLNYYWFYRMVSLSRKALVQLRASKASDRKMN